MRKEKLVISAVSTAILVLLVPLTLAQEPSPAFGGYLDLNGIDNFALCPDSDSLDKNLGDFSIEAWIYPRRKPKRDEQWIIATKPDSYELAMVGAGEYRRTHVPDFGIVFRVYFDDVDPDDLVSDRYMAIMAQKGEFPGGFQFGEWHHIVGRFHKKLRFEWQGKKEVGSFVTIYIDGSRMSSSGLVSVRTPPNTPRPLYVGGIGGREGSYFDGCIDELRISNVPNPMVADDLGGMDFLFDRGRRMLGLWHFDEPGGANSFQDASGNGNALSGKGGGFPVASKGKLAATWARVKSGR